MARMSRSSVALGLTMLVTAALVTAAAAGCAGSTPLPVPSPTTSTPPSVPPAATGSAAPLALDGTSFFFVRTGSSVQVLSVRGGTVTRLRQLASPADDSCPANSVVVSPDGQWLAWVTGVRTLGDITGTLSVVRADGSSPHTVDNVICSITESDWTPEGLEVVQTVGQTSTYVTVDPATGAARPRTTPTDAVRSGNGAFRVRRNGDVRNSFVVETASGTVIRTVRDYANDSGGFRLCGYTLHGVSDDGRYVAIGGCSTDPSRILGADHLYDSRAGRHVTLPVKSPDSITFAGGGVLVHDDGGESGGGRLVLASMSGEVLLEAAEPVDLPAEAQFLVYVHA
jgi:hypothetical protein